MKPILPFLSIFLFSFLLSGCLATKKVQIKHKQTTQYLPNWIKTPSQKKSISVVASSLQQPNETFRYARDKAYKNAQRALQKKLQQKIATILTSFDTSKQEDIKTITQKIVNDSLTQAKVTKLFQTKTKKIFVLNTIKISYIIANMEKYLKNNQKLYQNFLIGKSDGSLVIQLQK